MVKMEGTTDHREPNPARSERFFWFLGWAYDFSKVATIVLLIGLITHYFFATILVVRGKSMEPNFTDGQVLIVNKITYRSSSPNRGDVVAMYWPGESEKRFIKRIIALPNETVKIENGQVLVDGIPIDESYLPDDLTTLPELLRQMQTNEFFVMGDNRFASSDSRSWGPVPKSFIVGKVQNKLFQISKRQ